MHRIRSVRRAALGLAAAAVVFGAAPAMAGAATSNCTYEPNGIGTVTVDDRSGPLTLKLLVGGTVIAISDTLGGDQPEICLGGGTFATTTNTNQIRVSSTLYSSSDGYVVDASGGAFGPGRSTEVDGKPELETTITNSGPQGFLKLIGTPQSDVIRIGGPLASVNYGHDNDTDLTVTSGSRSVEVDGLGGWDDIYGTGNSNLNPGPTSTRLNLEGGDGIDSLSGGDAPGDFLDGGPDNDYLYAVDKFSDHLIGGSETDHGYMNKGDTWDRLESWTYVD
jgi:hypothetical protein